MTGVASLSRPADATVRDAVLAALAYADVFHWPLTADEVHRALPVPSDRADVGHALASLVDRGQVACVDDLYLLGDARDRVAERRRREAHSARLWRSARRYGRVVAILPGVRMVAVSGSLAVNAADAAADVDLFVVTEDDRLWTTRAFVVATVRLASVLSMGRTVLCPNFMVAMSNLALAEHDPFTAHELAQLVPLAGVATYERLLTENMWFLDHLPNAVSRASIAARSKRRPVSAWALRRSAVGRFEQWERRRKTARLAAAAPSVEAHYADDACKGHVDGHRARILAEYEWRLGALGLTTFTEVEA
ncbi:MAG TPA: hypothetical protein VGM78_09810 [Ilumatobacteraceae bacterium]